MPVLKRIPSSVLLGVANLTDVASSLVRGVALAHILSPEQFGLAITVSVVAGIIDLITDLGITPLAIRATEPRTLSTLQSIMIIRGLIIGAFTMILSPLFAYLFNAPGSAQAYFIVGLGSIIRGFAHLDVDARTRAYDFTPKVISSIASQLVWSLVSIATAYRYHNFLSMSLGVLGFMVTYVVMSHLLSQTPWRLAWDKPTARESWQYGRLLALNGVASAVSSLGDRALTGAKVGLTQLAHYTTLTTSALLPRAALARYLGSVFTPHFVNARTPEEQRHVSRMWALTVAAIGGTFGLGFTALGQPVTRLIYGKNYDVEQSLVALVAVLGMIRYLGCLPTPPILAYGRNEILVRYTTGSMIGLAIGAGLLIAYHQLQMLLLGMCIGEFCALMWLLGQLGAVMPITKRYIYSVMLLPSAAVIAAVIVTELHPAGSLTFRLTVCLVMYTAFAVCFRIVSNRSHCSARQLIRAFIPARVEHARLDSSPV